MAKRKRQASVKSTLSSSSSDSSVEIDEELRRNAEMNESPESPTEKKELVTIAEITSKINEFVEKEHTSIKAMHSDIREEIFEKIPGARDCTRSMYFLVRAALCKAYESEKIKKEHEMLKTTEKETSDALRDLLKILSAYEEENTAEMIEVTNFEGMSDAEKETSLKELRAKANLQATMIKEDKKVIENLHQELQRLRTTYANTPKKTEAKANKELMQENEKLCAEIASLKTKAKQYKDEAEREKKKAKEMEEPLYEPKLTESQMLSCEVALDTGYLKGYTRGRADEKDPSLREYCSQDRLQEWKEEVRIENERYDNEPQNEEDWYDEDSQQYEEEDYQDSIASSAKSASKSKRQRLASKSPVRKSSRIAAMQKDSHVEAIDRQTAVLENLLRQNDKPRATKLTHFTGKVDDNTFYKGKFPKWLQYFEEQMEDTEEKEKRKTLVECLRGAALEYYMGLDISIKRDYDTLCRYLSTNFGSHKTELAVMQEFARMRQRENESLSDYLAKRYNQAFYEYKKATGREWTDSQRKLELASRLNEELTDVMITSTDTPELNPNVSYEEYVELLFKKEIQLLNRKKIINRKRGYEDTRDKPAQGNNTFKRGRGGKPFQTNSKRYCKRCRQQGHDTRFCPMRGIQQDSNRSDNRRYDERPNQDRKTGDNLRCYNCGEMGHRANECTKPKKDQPSQRQQPTEEKRPPRIDQRYDQPRGGFQNRGSFRGRGQPRGRGYARGGRAGVYISERHRESDSKINQLYEWMQEQKKSEEPTKKEDSQEAMFNTRYNYAVEISDRHQAQNATTKEVNYSVLPDTDMSNTLSKDMMEYMATCLKFEGNPTNQEKVITTTCKTWADANLIEFAREHFDRLSQKGMTVRLAEQAIKDPTNFVELLRLHQVRHMMNDKRVFELQKFAEAHTHRASSTEQATCPIRIGNIVMCDVLMDTGAQVNLITMQTLVYGAMIDANWSNAILCGVWNLPPWNISGIASAMEVRVLGTVMLPVMSLNGEQKLVMFAVYNDKCRKIIMGTEALKELNFRLLCMNRPRLNLMDSPDAEEWKDQMKKYIQMIKGEDADNPLSQPLYERLAKTTPNNDKSQALVFKDGQFELTTENPTDPISNQAYTLAMMQRERVRNERKSFHDKLETNMNIGQTDQTEIEKETLRAYREQENHFFEREKKPNVRKRKPLETLYDERKRSNFLTQLRH